MVQKPRTPLPTASHIINCNMTFRNVDKMKCDERRPNRRRPTRRPRDVSARAFHLERKLSFAVRGSMKPGGAPPVKDCQQRYPLTFLIGMTDPSSQMKVLLFTFLRSIQLPIRYLRMKSRQRFRNPIRTKQRFLVTQYPWSVANFSVG